MKKHFSFKRFTILAIIVLCAAFLIIFAKGWNGDFQKATALHDAAIYTEGKYLDKEKMTDRIYNAAVYFSENFLPEYKEAADTAASMDFYAYDGSVKWKGVTLVLDLKFDGVEKFNGFLGGAAEKFPSEEGAFEFTCGDYACRRVRTAESTNTRFAMLCVNESELVLRYLCFQEYDASRKRFAASKKYVLECTNCPW